MEKNDRSLERARQFMPFAALRGFTELIREQETVPEPKRKLTEAAKKTISDVLATIRRGTVITVTYHDGSSYRTMTGMVSQVDSDRRKLRVIKTDIPFDTVYEMKIIND